MPGLYRKQSPFILSAVLAGTMLFTAAEARAQQNDEFSLHNKLMQTRSAFKTRSVKRLGDNSLRYTMTYTGPDRHYTMIRFGLYPDAGKAQAYSILTGRLYRGRDYPVSFECNKLANRDEKSLRVLLDQVEYHQSGATGMLSAQGVTRPE